MADVQQMPSHDNLGANVNRPEMPHRSSSTQNVPHKENEPGAPLERVPSVPRPGHRGPSHAESKPYKHDPNEQRVGHDGTVPDKVDLDGPPQPDWDRAERERQERREKQKQAEEKGTGGKDYPEQIHAGKIGVGPSIADRNHATFSEKLTGIKEVVLGKVKHDAELQQHGRDMMTGALKRREHENEDEKMADKFKKPDEKKPQEQKQEAKSVEHQPEQHAQQPQDQDPKPQEHH